MKSSFRVLLVFLTVFSLFAVVFSPTPTRAASYYVYGKVWIEAGSIVDGDCFSLDPSCGNQLSQLCDNNATTYLFFSVYQRGYFEFPWGATVWSGVTEAQVEQSIRNRSPGWTRDCTTTCWPRDSGYQPQNSTQISTSATYPTYIYSGDFLVIYSTAHFIQNSCGNTSQIPASYPYTLIRITQYGKVYVDYSPTSSLLFRNATETQMRQCYPGPYTSWP